MGCPPSRASTQPTSAARLQAAPTTDRGRSSSTPDRPPEPGGNLTGVTTLNTELAPSGAATPSVAVITATSRRTRSAAIIGNLSLCPSAQAVVDKHVAFFNIASFTQTLAKGDDHVRIFPSRCLQRSRHRNAVSTDGRHATEYGLVPRGGRRICLRFPQWKRLREWEGIRHPTSQPLDPQTPSASDVTDAIGQRKLVQPILAWTTRIRDSHDAQAS